MIDACIWITPLALMALLLLFRFVACDRVFGLDQVSISETYPQVVGDDHPVGYWRLQETGAVGLVAHAAAASAGGPAAATTPGVDSTGATLLVIGAVDFGQNSTTDNVSDSFGNAWHALNLASQGSSNLAIWYAWDRAGNPLAVGPGHTVRVAGSYCSLEFTAWSGSRAGSDPFDQQNAGGASDTSAKPGSITPSVPGCLVVTAAGFRAAGTYNADSGFTVSDQSSYVDGVSMGSAQAFLVQGNAAPTNPTWSTNGAAADIACAIASFLPGTGTVTAKNEAGAPDGNLGVAATPLPAGDPAWLSPPVTVAVLQVGVKDPPIETADPTVTSYRLDGGFVRVPFTAALNPPKFSLEMLAIPEWPTLSDGKYYCAIESSGGGTANPPAPKNRGYAIYAGPDNPGDPASTTTWQVWAGEGNGFTRMTLMNPLAPGDPGLAVVALPTYLAFTYDGSEALLHIYHKDRDLNFLKYKLTPVNYTPETSEDLFIGISGPDRALFAPFPGPDPPNGFLYPFHGRIAEVAIYDKALAEERLIAHGNAAFTS